MWRVCDRWWLEQAHKRRRKTPKDDFSASFSSPCQSATRAYRCEDLPCSWLQYETCRFPSFLFETSCRWRVQFLRRIYRWRDPLSCSDQAALDMSVEILGTSSCRHRRSGRALAFSLRSRDPCRRRFSHISLPSSTVSRFSVWMWWKMRAAEEGNHRIMWRKHNDFFLRT